MAAVLMALTGCTRAGNVTVTPTPDRSTGVRAAMGKYNQCFSQMNADCTASLFAPQGQIFNTGIIRAGSPAAIRNYLNQSFESAHIDSLISTIDTIVLNGDVAAVLGTYDEQGTDATGQSYELKLQYVAEWLESSNGQWWLNRLSTVLLR